MRFYITIVIGFIAILALTLWLVYPLISKSVLTAEWKAFSFVLWAMFGSGVVCLTANYAMRRDEK